MQFQAQAEVADLAAHEIVEAIERGALRSLTRHGELDIAGGCFIRVELPLRLVTYGLGMSLRSLIAEPLAAAGAVHVEAWS